MAIKATANLMKEARGWAFLILAIWAVCLLVRIQANTSKVIEIKLYSPAKPALRPRPATGPVASLPYPIPDYSLKMPSDWSAMLKRHKQ